MGKHYDWTEFTFGHKENQKNIHAFIRNIDNINKILTHCCNASVQKLKICFQNKSFLFILNFPYSRNRISLIIILSDSRNRYLTPKVIALYC